jgi:hypothetical protein
MPAERCFVGDHAFGMATDLTLLAQREQKEPAVRIPSGAGYIDATRYLKVQV